MDDPTLSVQLHVSMKAPLSALALLFAAFTVAPADEEARALISSGGGSIELGKSVPGRIDLTDDQSFPLLFGDGGSIVAAAASAGEGRAVAFTHGSFLKPGELLAQEPTLQLVANAVRWAGRSSKPKVGLHRGVGGLVELFAQADIDAEVIEPGDVRSGRIDVYCVIGHEILEDAEIVRLFEFVNDGGGLVVATTPWAFGKKFEPFSTFPGNQLLAAAGMQFEPDGYAGGKTLAIGPSSDVPAMAVDGEGPAPTALARRLVEDPSAVPKAQAATALLEAKFLRGANLEEFLSLLLQLNETVGPIVPTEENPLVPGADPLIDAIVELESHFNETAPAGTMYAIPAAADYPGEVPDDAERVSQTFSIDGTWRGWLEGRNAGGWAAKEMRPTGLYAAPGEVVSVTLPARIAGEGFEVVIGSYGGNLRNRDQWHRYPDWQVKADVVDRVTKVSSGLGGLITIRVPRGAEYEEIEVSIEGAIPAPLYVHGETDPSAWASEIRQRPAPWAELASDRMIVAVPSEYIRGLSDPGPVMEVWDRYIEAAADLVMVDRNDYRAERIVFDRQTSAGSMHSSYPVAAHLGDAAEKAVDARLLAEGDWGFFHEYGHNHQHDLWSLPGTGETTCNLWSVYLYEEVVGTHRDETHRAIRPLDRKQRVNAYFSSGANFEKDWSVWTALETYLMVQEKFGWEPFRKVFDEYNRLAPAERPQGQDQINDQWVIRLSKACGTNLAPFWRTWNLPLSSDVDRALADLPAWEDHPVARFSQGG